MHVKNVFRKLQKEDMGKLHATEVFVITLAFFLLQTAPLSSVGQPITVSNVRANSLVVEWQAPSFEQRNATLVQYTVTVHSSMQYANTPPGPTPSYKLVMTEWVAVADKQTGQSCKEILPLDGLEEGFAYIITVQACTGWQATDCHVGNSSHPVRALSAGECIANIYSEDQNAFHELARQIHKPLQFSLSRVVSISSQFISVLSVCHSAITASEWTDIQHLVSSLINSTAMATTGIQRSQWRDYKLYGVLQASNAR